MRTVEFVLWNMAHQFATDSEGNSWRVIAWYGEDEQGQPYQLHMVPYGSPRFDDLWELVEQVVVMFGNRTAAFRPDDFNEGIELN